MSRPFGIRRQLGEILGNQCKRGAGLLGAALSCVSGPLPSVGILVYHRVTDHVTGVPRPTMNVRPSRFRQQLVGLLEQGFQPWPLSRLLAACARRETPPARTFVVTFDDIFASVYYGAWPALRDLHVPATAFVATAYLDSPDPFPFDDWGRAFRGQLPDRAYQPVTLEQCREMLSGGFIELGAHTHTHRDFRKHRSDFGADLRQSVDRLRDLFGVETVPFAFPFGRTELGYVDPDFLAQAQRAGVSCALTTDCVPIQPGTPPFGWGRFNVYDWDTSRTVAAKLAGWYGWSLRVQEWLRHRMPRRHVRMPSIR